MTSTILGGYGFIGNHLATELDKRGEQCWLPKRGDSELFRKPLGTVYYCVGLTSDFRKRPYDTVNAHVCFLKDILEKTDFKRLIYLSTTRVYAKNSIAEETQAMNVESFIPDDLYNISKLMGESLVLSAGRACCVARLSNVLGDKMGTDNFIGMLLEEAGKDKSVHFETSLESEKDYIWIDDVVNSLISISENGTAPIYNVAGGKNIAHKIFAELLEDRGVSVTVAENARKISFSPISIERLITDTGIVPSLSEYKLSNLFDRIMKGDLHEYK